MAKFEKYHTFDEYEDYQVVEGEEHPTIVRITLVNRSSAYITKHDYSTETIPLAVALQLIEG